MNQNTDADKLSVVVAEFVMGGWIAFRLEGGGVVVCYRKKIHKEEGEMRKRGRRESIARS